MKGRGLSRTAAAARLCALSALFFEADSWIMASIALLPLLVRVKPAALASSPSSVHVIQDLVSWALLALLCHSYVSDTCDYCTPVFEVCMVGLEIAFPAGNVRWVVQNLNEGWVVSV